MQCLGGLDRNKLDFNQTVLWENTPFPGSVKGLPVAGKPAKVRTRLRGLHLT